MIREMKEMLLKEEISRLKDHLEYLKAEINSQYGKQTSKYSHHDQFEQYGQLDEIESPEAELRAMFEAELRNEYHDNLKEALLTAIQEAEEEKPVSTYRLIMFM